MTRPATLAFGLPCRALMLSVVLLGSACADLPARAPVAPQPSSAALAQQITVRGVRGPVSPEAEARTLAGVRAEGQPDLLARQLAALAALGNADLYRGNRAELLIDGPATLGAMKAAIEAARHRVLLETYIFEDNGLAADIAALLVRKAASGVAVALIGVAHVVVQGDWSHLAQLQWVAGDAWIGAAAVAWAAYALLQKKWHSPLSATARLATICMGGVAVLLPFALWELASADTPPLGPAALGLIVLTALVPGLG